ncbi:hypothetical protein SAMN05444955_10260 [Lihuaxuella thermophila]|uniref:Uncharacterized protein n=1 Tax=Lihuaxuella thermophila TaxID=1173111 RepID=A0A1H8B8D1_9BACL|nr:hypothetical protein SAMN05444955_10260 [Lihuaxuella thermophila]
MKKQRVANDSLNCALGLINGLILSLPLWGLIYFFVRFIIGS